MSDISPGSNLDSQQVNDSDYVRDRFRAIHDREKGLDICRSAENAFACYVANEIGKLKHDALKAETISYSDFFRCWEVRRVESLKLEYDGFKHISIIGGVLIAANGVLLRTTPPNYVNLASMISGGLTLVSMILSLACMLHCRSQLFLDFESNKEWKKSFLVSHVLCLVFLGLGAVSWIAAFHPYSIRSIYVSPTAISQPEQPD